MPLILPPIAIRMRKGITLPLVVASLWTGPWSFAAKPPDAAKIAPPAQVATDAFGDPLPPGAIARLGCMRLRHGGRVSSLAYSPDGKLLASGGDFDLIRLWDPHTGKEIRRLHGHNGSMHGLAFSRNGKLLASCGRIDRSPLDCILLWDLRTGKKLCRFSHSSKKNGEQAALSVAISPDGKVLASGGTGGSIYLWDIETRNVLHYFRAPRGTDMVAFSPDGAVLFSASRSEETIRRWDVSSGKELQPLAGHKKGTQSMAFEAKGRFLVSSGGDGFCRIWDLTGDKEQLRISAGKGVVAYSTFSPDGKIVAGVIGKKIQFWDAANGNELRQFPVEDWAVGLVFAPDGSALAWGDGSFIHLIDPRTGKQRFPRKGHKGGISRIAFSSDGTKVLTSGTDNTTRAWEARTGRELLRYSGSACAFSPDGKRAASSAEDGKSIRLWDTGTGKEIHRLPGKAPPAFWRFFCHAFSADGMYFASNGGMNLPTRIWDTATEKEVRQIPTQGLLGALALSPNGKYLAATEYTGWNKPIVVWDIGSGREIKVLSRKESSANALAFAPDGAILAAASSSPGIQFWDIHSGRECGQVAVPLTYVGALAFSPDGKNLATVGGFDGSAYLWEIATSKMRRRFEGHAGRVRTVTFSSDGTLMATGGDDGTPLVWDVIDVAPSRQGRQTKLTPQELADCLAALNSEDAEKAWQAVRKLVAGSEQVVSFLGERLAAQTAAAEKAARWIAELDDDAFAVRDRASRELAALGKTAIPALRKAQEKPSSTETARRVKDLLDKLGKPGLSPAELAGLRSIEVLEHLNTPEARRLLTELANGTADTRLRWEAKASLRRLRKR